MPIQKALEHIWGDTYFIVEERTQTLHKVQFDFKVGSLDVAAGQKFSLSVFRESNKGFEGLAFDREGEVLFLAKERNPVRILEIKGLTQKFGQALTCLIRRNSARDSSLFIRDISSLGFDPRSNI